MRSLPSILRAGLWLALAAGTVAASEPVPHGDPLYRRYTADDFAARPRNFDIAVDRDGRIFVANAEGVLQTDGQAWRRIPMPGEQPARSLALGRDGRMYVGGYDRVGVLQPDHRGDLVFRDLTGEVAESGHHVAPLGTVWQTLAADRGIWFRAESALLFHPFDGGPGQRVALPPQARSFYLVDDVLHARVDGVGVVRLDDGELLPVPGGEAFADQLLAAVVAAEGRTWFVGGKGFYVHDAAGLRPQASAADALFAQDPPYTATRLSDGSLVVGTFGGELQRYDGQLRLLDRMQTGPYTIESLALDREGCLWAATESELLQMRLPAPWTRFDGAHGLRGSIYASEWHDGALWLAGTRGIGRLRARADRRPRVDWFDWTDYEGYALHSTAHGLLVGHRDGLAVVEADLQPRLLGAAGEAVFQLVPSSHDPDRIYARGAGGILMARREAGRWQFAAQWSLGETSANGLVETAPDEIWIDDIRGGPQRWRLDLRLGTVLERQGFGRQDGLSVDPEAGSRVHRLDDRLYVVSGQQTFAWDGAAFSAVDLPPFSLVERPMELSLVSAPTGTFAFTPHRLFRRAHGSREWEPVRFEGTTAIGVEGVSVGSDGVVRVSTWSGLLQHSSGEAEHPLPPLRVELASLDASQSDGRPLRWTDNLDEGVLRMLSGSYLSFRFGVITHEPGLEYRYRVHGVTDRWSDWVTSPELGMRVRPGLFRIEVEARTRSGREIAPFSLRVDGEPRWYEAWWARGFAGLSALLALVMATQWVVRRRTARYLAANRRLEGRIAERTRELEEANRRLAELAVEDALTGVSNRRALESGLQREWQRGIDLRRSLAVLMIDVDHFKRYNDRHGHLEGDAMLRRVAERLREDFDPQRELLARFGGEEFALLLPGTHLEQAQQRAERLRAAFDRPEDEISVSIGVAAQVPHAADEPHGLLRRADAALYRAKRNGRNRVEVANE